METWDTWKVHRGRSLGRRILVRFCPKLEVPAPLMACALIHMWSLCNDQPSRIFTGWTLMEYLILEVEGLWVLWMDGWPVSCSPCFYATSSLLHSLSLIHLMIVCRSIFESSGHNNWETQNEGGVLRVLCVFGKRHGPVPINTSVLMSSPQKQKHKHKMKKYKMRNTKWRRRVTCVWGETWAGADKHRCANVQPTATLARTAVLLYQHAHIARCKLCASVQPTATLARTTVPMLTFTNKLPQ